jgi:hypothetical protein
MGYHLGSDVLHDFGALYNNFPLVQYHTKPPLKGITSKEDDVVTYFDENADIKKRKLMNIKFTVPKNTSVFGSWTPPNLTGVENGSVGIVYDAGDKITKQLGAKNVITFGSVLDPSKKPVLGPDDPIWFDVGAGTSVDIPLTMFGFDHTKIRSLGITNFIGTSTCAIFDTSAGRFDAISGPTAPADPAVCTSKPINESRASKVGYFVSIKEAKDNVARLLVDNNAVSNQRAMFYLAGKTLGDTMLVASCMKKFGDVPNLFHLTNAAGGVWKKLSGDAAVGGPSTLILKTQDRLNHTRALIMEVPSILQSKFEYTFVPGSIDDGQQVEIYNLGYARLRTGLANRYDELIKSLDGRLRGMVDVDDGKVITGGITYKFNDEFKKGLANNLIDKIVRALESIKRGVIAAYDEDKKGPPAGEEVTSKTIKPFYENIYKKYNKLAPATTSIFDDEGSLERHIVVSLGGDVIPKKLMIDFMTDFQGITKARVGGPAGGPIEWVIKGDASNLLEQTGESMRAVADAMRLEEAPPTRGGMPSNAAAAAAADDDDAASDEMEDVPPVPPEFDMTRHFKNLESGFLAKVDRSREPIILSVIDQDYVNAFSVAVDPARDGGPAIGEALYIIRDNAGTLLNDFIKYASRYGGVRAHMFVRGAKTIDNMLWSELLADYKHATKKECIETKDAQNHMTVLFNAFVCHINATNSMLDDPGFDMNYANLAIAVDDEDYAKEMDETTQRASRIPDAMRVAAARAEALASAERRVDEAAARRRSAAKSSAKSSVKASASNGDGSGVETAAPAPRRAMTEEELAAARNQAAANKLPPRPPPTEAIAVKVAKGEEANVKVRRRLAASIEDSRKAFRRDLASGLWRARRGGTRRKKRAGTYRKKRKDKGTL